MDKIDEYKIEQFLRFPEEMSHSEHNEIRQLIEDEPEAKAIAEWLSSFYEKYDELNKPNVITLSLREYNPKTTGPMVLAAMSFEPEDYGLKTKATLASEEYQTLLRVLEDQKSHEYQFHVISKFISPKDRVLITIDDLGIDLITDKGGKLKNVQKSELSDLNWNGVLAQLRVSICTCEYEPGPDARIENITVCDECSITVSNQECTLHAFKTKISSILVEQDEETRLLYLNTNVISFPVNSEKPFRVHLYA
ncbi:MAG TPA: hypothetical protein DCL80_00585 [Balneola sp.]|nr:hypothetical protein [Balneola sp.]MAO76204.1 hypothetical protein [Balneola sp.]MBF63945.1 hypothetical protein [Balneola sp.]HAH49832.1 hypothetical protein [Balneola sp.]HAW81508.1 hypothetical protein [Balneola sp.]